MTLTPGPWKAYRDTLTQNAWTIDVQHKPGGHEKVYQEVAVAFRGEADARLIAAAPDMLEALRAAINADDSIPPNVAAIINKAIAKAEGK